jgi:glucose-6-phosphate 1-dehydrogenase
MVGSDVELVAQRYPHHDMEPYERLLLEAARGEPEFFARQDAVEEAWRIVDPILGDTTPLYDYDPGTWGPAQADALIAADTGWHNPCDERPENQEPRTKN